MFRNLIEIHHITDSLYQEIESYIQHSLPKFPFFCYFLFYFLFIYFYFFN